MKTKWTLLTGAAVIGAGLAGAAGVHHVQDEIIPQRMTQDMNATFNDLFVDHAFYQGATIEKSGDIEVVRDGFFSYKATLPELTITMDLKDPSLELSRDGVVAEMKTTIASSEFAVNVTDKMAALLSASGVSKDTPLQATLTNAAPVSFSSTLFEPGREQQGDKIEVTGSCGTVTGESSVLGGQYSLTTTGADCSLNGTAASQWEKDPVFTLTSGMNFTTTISNDGQDVYSGDKSVTFDDLTMLFGNPAFPEGTFNAESVTFSGSFGELAAPKTGEPSGEETQVLPLTALPNAFSAAVEAKNMTLEIPFMLPKGPSVSFNGAVSFDGLKKESGDMSVEFGYELKGFEALGIPVDVPTKEACSVDVKGVPFKPLTGFVEDGLSPEFITPEEALDRNGVIAALQGNQTSVDVDCSVSADKYSASFEAQHKVEGESFPGKGRFEVRGIDEAFNSLAMFMGPQIRGLGDAVLKPMGQPTEDGEGMKWDYTIDAEGNVSVNGNPVTQLPPMMPR